MPGLDTVRISDTMAFFMNLLDRHTTKTIWALAWPTVLHSFLQTFVGFVDTIMVGRLDNGVDAISAVGMSQQLIFVVMVGVLAISTGCTTFVAQFYGAGQHEDVSRTVAQSLLMALALGAVVGVLGFVSAGSLLDLIRAPDEIQRLGVSYMRIFFGGVFFFFFGFISAAVLRGAGDTVTPLKVSVVVNVVNVVANYALIFGAWGCPRMEVAGAALGSVIARAVGAVLGMYILFSGRFRVRLQLARFREISLSLMGRVLRVGIPSGLQGVVRNGTRLAFFAIVAGSLAGRCAIAAVTIGFRVRMIAIMPALAIQVAAVALVGQRIGQKKIDEAERFGWGAIWLCTTIMTGIGLLLFVFAPWVVRLFTTSPETIEIGATMLRFFIVGQTFAAASIATGGSLAGAGDTAPAFFYALIGQCFVMLPLAYVLCYYTRLDVVGVWIAWVTAEALQLVLILLRFRGGEWKTMKV